MHHDMIDPECDGEGIMSYYSRFNDAIKLRSMWDSKWDDVWTDCSHEDYRAGPPCLSSPAHTGPGVRPQHPGQRWLDCRIVGIAV